MPESYLIGGELLKNLRRIIRKVDHIRGPGIKNEDERITFTPAAYPRPAAAAPGGESRRYKIVTVHDDYLTCHTWDGTNEGSDAILIAKPKELRIGGLTSITRWDYTSGANITITVTTNTGSDTHDPWLGVSATGFANEAWYITPGYAAGDEIYADTPNGGTGVQVSGTDLTLLDTNRAGRAWGWTIT